MKKIEKALLVARMVIFGRALLPYSKTTPRLYDTPCKEGILMAENGKVRAEKSIFKKTVQFSVDAPPADTALICNEKRRILVSTDLKNPVVTVVLPMKEEFLRRNGPPSAAMNLPMFGTNAYGIEYRPEDGNNGNKYLYAAEHFLAKAVYEK